MIRQHQYRVTHFVHADFGNGPVDRIAHLSIVPDGSVWAQNQRTLQLRVEGDELAHGDTVTLTIERDRPERPEPKEWR